MAGSSAILGDESTTLPRYNQEQEKIRFKQLTRYYIHLKNDGILSV